MLGIPSRPTKRGSLAVMDRQLGFHNLSGGLQKACP